MKSKSLNLKESYKLRIKELNVKFASLDIEYDIDQVINNLNQLDRLEQEIINEGRIDELTKMILCANILKIKSKDFLLYYKLDHSYIIDGRVAISSRMNTNGKEKIEVITQRSDKTGFENIPIHIKFSMDDKDYYLNISDARFESVDEPNIMDVYNWVSSITEKYPGKGGKTKFLHLGLNSDKNGRFKKIMHGFMGFGEKDICLDNGLIIDFLEEKESHHVCTLKKVGRTPNEITTIDYLLDGSGCILRPSLLSKETYNYIDGKLKYVCDDKNNISLDFLNRLGGNYLKSYMQRKERVPMTCDKMSDMDLTR